MIFWLLLVEIRNSCSNANFVPKSTHRKIYLISTYLATVNIKIFFYILTKHCLLRIGFYRFPGVNGELIHKCSCCPLYFATKQEAQEHSMKEHEDRLKCTYCNKVYKDLDCISAHIRKLHTKTAAPQKKYTFVCIKCGKNFNSRVALSDHGEFYENLIT